MFSEKSCQIQLAILAFLVLLMTVGAFTYVVVEQPESLQLTREGVPFFTPPVIHPDTGEPVSVDQLVEHFKGDG